MAPPARCPLIVQCLVLAAVLQRVCALSTNRTTSRYTKDVILDPDPPRGRSTQGPEAVSLSFLFNTSDAATTLTTVESVAPASYTYSKTTHDHLTTSPWTSTETTASWSTRDRSTLTTTAASAAPGLPAGEVTDDVTQPAVDRSSAAPAPRRAAPTPRPRGHSPRAQRTTMRTSPDLAVHTTRPIYMDRDVENKMGSHHLSRGATDAVSALNAEDALREEMMREEVEENKRFQNEVLEPAHNRSALDKKSLYAVSAAYRRGRKLGPVSARSYYKHPDDNSWRNESISSLGIVFKPNNGSKPLTAVLRGRSGAEPPAPAAPAPEPGDLRERLEKLAEARKSRKRTEYREPEGAALTTHAAPPPRGKYKKLGLDYYVGPAYGGDEYASGETPTPPAPPAPPARPVDYADDAEFDKKMRQFIGDYLDEPPPSSPGPGPAPLTEAPAAIPDEPEHEGSKAARVGRYRQYLNEVERERDYDEPPPPPPPPRATPRGPVLYNTSVLHGAGAGGAARSSAYFKQESARQREPGAAGGAAGGEAGGGAGGEAEGRGWEGELDSLVCSPDQDEADCR